MPYSLLRICTAFFFVLILLNLTNPAGAQLNGYDPDGFWPLCGNYGTTNWNDETTCSRSGPTSPRDLTNDTFGPRLVSGVYDWHRGLDMNTEQTLGRPVFAFTCGVVVEATRTADEINRTLVIRHFRDHVCVPGENLSILTCSGIDDVGCYYTQYSHLFEVDSNLSPGDQIEAGQLIGKTGLNCNLVGVPTDYPQFSKGTFTCTKPSGSTCDCVDGQCARDPLPSSGDGCYEHLHFEVRDSRGTMSQGKGWSQRKAIHPLKALPYNNSIEANDMTLALTVQSQPSASGNYSDVEATVTVTMPDTDFTYTGTDTDLDLQRVEVYVYEDWGPALGLLIQPNPGENYKTPELVAFPTMTNPAPDSVPYQVFPPYLDFVQRNLQYNYEQKLICNGPEQNQDCSPLLFDEFTNDQAYESPYADTAVLIDPRFDPVNFPTAYNSATADYHLERKAEDAMGQVVNSQSDFNGILIAPEELPTDQNEYELTITFSRLQGPIDPKTMCVQAVGIDAREQATDPVFYGEACGQEIGCGSCHADRSTSMAVWTPEGESELMKIPLKGLLRSHLAFLDAALEKR